MRKKETSKKIYPEFVGNVKLKGKNMVVFDFNKLHTIKEAERICKEKGYPKWDVKMVNKE